MTRTFAEPIGAYWRHHLETDTLIFKVPSGEAMLSTDDLRARRFRETDGTSDVDVLCQQYALRRRAFEHLHLSLSRLDRARQLAQAVRDDATWAAVGELVSWLLAEDQP